MSRRLRGRLGDGLVAALLALALLVMLAPAWHRPESPFDEGFALAYGVRVLDGDVPHRDFVSFYGPGNPWLVAGAFAIGGTSQATERVVGAAYRLLIVLGVAGLAAAGGRAAALAAGAAAIPLLVIAGLAALGAFGALGLSLAALALLASARSGRSTSADARALGAGLLAGAAALVRPEAFAALAIAALPLLGPLPRRRRLAAALGLVPAVVAWSVHLAIVGAERAERVLSDLRASGSGRHLPFDLNSPVPATTESSRVLVLLVILAVAAIVLAWLARRRGGDAWRAPLALALLALALLPYVLSRLDYTHAVIALVPATGALVAAIAARAERHRDWLAVGAAAATVAVATAAAPNAIGSPTKTHADRLLGRVDPPGWVQARVDGRGFWMDAAGAASLQRILDAAERERRRGARTLFVGPRDLRTSNLNDAVLYYLLEDLEPASYYLELNPWTANAPGSGLAGELARADLIVLNRQWDVMAPPNPPPRLGSDAPNRVVRRHFCLVAGAGPYELMRRCR